MICAVTDASRRDVLDLVKEAVDAGVDLVQIREPQLEASRLAALVERAVALARGSATRIVVNDRLDAALARGADGVHLRANSIPADAARELAPRPFLVGRSVHEPREASAAGTVVDYLIAGTVFRTASKPMVIGLDGLRAIVAAARVPVLAIGGVTLDGLDGIAATGAAGVAAISLFAPFAPLRDIVGAIRERFGG